MSVAPHLAVKTRLTHYIGNRIAISFDKVSDDEIEALIQVCQQELEQRKEKPNDQL